jgi:HD-like signal output (HDOD) protein
MIEEVPAPLGQIGEWLLLKWDLPYEVTRLAGTVKYAVSVVA